MRGMLVSFEGSEAEDLFVGAGLDWPLGGGGGWALAGLAELSIAAGVPESRGCGGEGAREDRGGRLGLIGGVQVWLSDGG